MCETGSFSDGYVLVLHFIASYFCVRYAVYETTKSSLSLELPVARLKRQAPQVEDLTKITSG